MSDQSNQIEILKYAVELGREAERHKNYATQLALINVCDRQNQPVPAPLFLSSATPYLGQQPVLGASVAAEPTKRAEVPSVLDQLIAQHPAPAPVAAIQSAVTEAVTETVADVDRAARSVWKGSRDIRRGIVIGIVLIIAWRLGWLNWLSTTVMSRLKTLTPPPAIESPVAPSSPSPDPPTEPPATEAPPESSPVPPVPADSQSMEQMLEDILKGSPAAQ